MNDHDPIPALIADWLGAWSPSAPPPPPPHPLSKFVVVKTVGDYAVVECRYGWTKDPSQPGFSLLHTPNMWFFNPCGAGWEDRMCCGFQSADEALRWIPRDPPHSLGSTACRKGNP